MKNEGGVRRVGVVGDVHTEERALVAAVDHLKATDVDVLLCVGDIVDGPNGENAVANCCTVLEREGFLTVCGNHDRWAADGTHRELAGATSHADLTPAARNFLGSLPPDVVLESVAGRVLLCHGLEGDDMAAVKPFDRGVALESNGALQAMLSPRKYDFVIHGHTHMRMVRTIDALTLINVGTLHRDHSPCFAIVDFEARVVQFYDVKADGAVTTAETMPLR